MRLPGSSIGKYFCRLRRYCAAFCLSARTASHFAKALLDKPPAFLQLFLERMDVLPKISITGNQEPINLEAPTFLNAVEVVVDAGTYTEDECNYTAATPKEVVRVYLEIARGDVALSPYAKRLGVSLNT